MLQIKNRQPARVSIAGLARQAAAHACTVLTAAMQQVNAAPSEKRHLMMGWQVWGALFTAWWVCVCCELAV